MSFDSQPVLKGELLELRPLRSEDLRDLYGVASDPLIWEQHPDDRHLEAVFEEFFRVGLASGGALLAIDARTQRVIGTSRYHGYDAEKSEVEIGWTFLAKSPPQTELTLELRAHSPAEIRNSVRRDPESYPPKVGSQILQ